MPDIEKDIPIPTERTKPTYNSNRPWHRMDIGDSVFIEGEDSQGFHMRSAQHYAYYRKNRVKFKSKREGSGIRIWRIA